MLIAQKHLKKILFIGLILVGGCSNSMNIKDYENNTPSFTLFNYFEGKTRGWGIFQDRSGALKRQFVVDITGTINEKGQLVLSEDFVWADGGKSTRQWTISKTNTNEYSGTASDVVGEAKGISAGNAFHWAYDLQLPVGDKIYKVHFDDWLYLQPNGVLLNRAKMSKFGFKVGEVFISFKKL